MNKLKNVLYPVSIVLLVLSGCNSAEDAEKEKQNALKLQRDMDSLEREDSMLRAKEKEETTIDLATFDFNGKWSDEMMSIEFHGDSAQFNTGGGNDDMWYRVVMDRSKNPIPLDLMYGKNPKDEVLAFSMWLTVSRKNYLSLTFGDDMTVRPADVASGHSVELTK